MNLLFGENQFQMLRWALWYFALHAQCEVTDVFLAWFGRYQAEVTRFWSRRKPFCQGFFTCSKLLASVQKAKLQLHLRSYAPKLTWFLRVCLNQNFPRSWGIRCRIREISSNILPYGRYIYSIFHNFIWSTHLSFKFSWVLLAAGLW